MNTQDRLYNLEKFIEEVDSFSWSPQQSAKLATVKRILR